MAAGTTPDASRAAENQAERVEQRATSGNAAGARAESPVAPGADRRPLKAMSYGQAATSVQPQGDDRAAAYGVSGTPSTLPHREVAEAAVGVDASAVRVHSDDRAKQACETLGAEAYAYGHDIAFARTPDAGTVAHELTHVAQQQKTGVAAVHRKATGGFGNPDPKGQLSTLHPIMKDKAQQLIDRAHQKGLNIWISEGYRSFAKQNELYAQGRTKPGAIVTWVQGGGSYHNYGLAVDMVFHGSQPWGEQHNWNKLGQAGQEVGLKWLGSIGDRPHFQIQGVTISQLKSWHAQGGMSLAWQKVSETLGGPAGTPPGGGGSAPTPQAGGTYTVQSGDTLGKIAKKTLGDANRWKEIANLNGLSNPNLIYPGQVLKIPGSQNTSGPAPQPTAPNPTPAPTTSSGTYTVKKGDTLGKIAQKTLGDSSKWALIAQANGISNPNVIYPGQVLKIPGMNAGNSPGPQTPTASAPGTGSGSSKYTVKKGDTLSKIAQKTLGSTSKWPLIAQANGITNPNVIYVGQVLTIPGASQPATPAPPPKNEQPANQAPATYTVKKGDTLGKIAQQTLGSSSKWKIIADANNLANPNVIYPGQVLKIPGGTATGPSPTPAPPTPTTPAPTGPQTYVVQKGDTLSGIAGKVWGSTSKWPELASMNGISAPYTIFPGQVLKLKPGAQAPAPQPGNTPPTTEPGPAPQPGGDANVDVSMQPPDPIPLGGLSGLNLVMAKIYNERGKFLKQKANGLGVSVAACAAVLKAEAGGYGFSSATGKMIVRFENHIFWSQWGSSNASTFHNHFQYSSGQSWKGHQWRPSTSSAWQEFHGNQTKEWEVLQFARGLNDSGALKSISMGIAQIMGFNHAKVGYGTVQEMFNAMANGIKPQINGMFTFIEKTPLCIQGLKEGDYLKFATGYNGSGNAANYAPIIQSAANSYAAVTAGRQFA